MNKYLVLFLIIILCCAHANALEIVYPKTNPVKINASSTFFIGSTNPCDKLKINDIEVKVSSSGAFAQVVPLNIGINSFTISSKGNDSPSIAEDNKQTSSLTSHNDVINFSIERTQPSPKSTTASTLIEYPMMNDFYVLNENSPLRMTPIDSGVNRMSHLPKNMQLFINGEKGSFYRVYLNAKLTGWIAKKDVEQKENLENIKNENSITKILDYKIKDEKDFYIYEFYLDRMTPFTLKEENNSPDKSLNSLSLQLFNVESWLGSPAKQEKFEGNTFTTNIPIKKLMGYDAYYKGNKFILKIRKLPTTDCCKPLKNIIIAVDAGHGGSEYGAIGCCGDKEKDINLEIAKNLQKELEKRGAKVVMTREKDIDVSLADRVNIGKEKDATLLISIHANALPDGGDPIKCRGTSIYYYHNQAKPLADNILESMTTQLGTQNDKVRQGSLALVRPTSSVSVLIEVAYIINPDDYALLLDEGFRQNCAKAIADGIEKYIKY